MIENYVLEICKKAKAASNVLASISTAEKNRALLRMADLISDRSEWIMEENAKDLKLGKEKGLSSAMLDRLNLTEDRIANISQSLREVASLTDPVFEIINQVRGVDGLDIARMRVPIGVIGIIYESRPNVTTEAASLCLKSSNVTVLRGGSESIHSNSALVSIIKEALNSTSIPEDAVNFIDTTDRAAVMHLLKMKNYIDIIIPRGGDSLIQTVVDNSNIPVIKHDKGVCNLYVHKDAKKDMVNNIALNAKTQRPGVCNAIENIIIHKDYPYTAELFSKLTEGGVELRGCDSSMGMDSNIKSATEEDYYTEYLDLILSAKIVSSFDEALLFINKYGSSHSDAIVTENYSLARRFIYEVDSSSVYANASTRFTDGQMFGMGAEIGISTNKLHARGPMALKELTTTKFAIFGEGQIRK